MRKRKKSKKEGISKGKSKEKMWGTGNEMQKVLFFIFSERESSFSLQSWEIRPSDFFETRREVVLLGEDNA